LNWVNSSSFILENFLGYRTSQALKFHRKHIELFAGCGGLSLGLERSGFELLFANELSPMASETFAYNLLGEDLLRLSGDNLKSEKVLWIKSNFPRNNLKERIKENPLSFNKGEYSDLNNKTDFSSKLIVGDIDNLLKYLNENKSIGRQLRNKDIDLLSGGPPCQGFSLAGKRLKEDDKNLLPLSFAKFAGLIRPKVVLLENVKGILSPFITVDGIKHYAWLEVAKAFALEGYIPICMLLNSKYFSVPQNRPRFILFAFRNDIFEKVLSSKSHPMYRKNILLNSLDFYNKALRNRKNLDNITTDDLAVYDIESDVELFDGHLLPKVLKKKFNFITSEVAIADISSTAQKYSIKKINSKYAIKLNHLFRSKNAKSYDILQNHENRNHTFKVRARFRLYQILNRINGMRTDALKVIQGESVSEYTFKKVFEAIKNEAILVNSNGLEGFEKPLNLSSFEQYLKNIGSKKHSQRAIKKDEPAPAQMTIPDDLCHYSISELRTLTVREMARLQSFPDWFEFRSKATTGGKQRSFEVPQYTQVGNAVPPLLAYELGKTINQILDTIN